MPLSRSELFQRLAALDIATTTVDHAPVFTVAESSAIESSMPGAHTKNLFLKDENGIMILVVAKTSTKIDLKALPTKIGSKRFSFGKPELMMEALGIAPGSVTAFAIANDTAQRVNIVIDAELIKHDSLNCHPLENNATTNIACDDLLRFIRSTGHEPRIITLTT